MDKCIYGVKGLSTNHALVNMLHHWHNIIHGGGAVRALFLDYNKAGVEINFFSRGPPGPLPGNVGGPQEN